MKSTSVFAVTVIALAGCSTLVERFKQPDSGGISRAAFELGCPENQLQVTDLGNNAIGVAGCGKKAVYLGVGASFITSRSELFGP